MCNILVLKAGQMMASKEEFINMCHNNWHSYGLVTSIDGRLNTIKKVPESGEIDAEEIWKLLERDRAYDRYLHVRHNTAGATSLENCHPFPVFYQERAGQNPREVLFMHNGTLYDYRPSGTDERSDSLIFTTEILTPVMASLDAAEGRGDLTDPLFQKLLKKFWPLTSNRGLLISSDQGFFAFGDWKKVKADDGSDILSANEEYFKAVTRGPEKTRREAAAKQSSFQGSTALTTVTNNQVRDVTPYTAFDLQIRAGRRHSVFELKGTFANISGDCNLWDRSTAVNIGLATQDELKELYNSGEKNAVLVMDWIFSDYYQLYEDHLSVVEKLGRQQKHLEQMGSELKELRAWMKDNGHYEKKAI